MDAARAQALLAQLVTEPGNLRIITNLPAPDAPTADPRDPAFNVQQAVVAIEQYHDGLVLARSHEGAVTIGAPVDLLIRLTEWQHFDPQAPETTHARTLAALEAR